MMGALQKTAAGMNMTSDALQALDQMTEPTLPAFLRGVATNSIQADVLCYCTRLTITGYGQSGDNRKSVSPIQPDARPLQHLSGLPLKGCNTASFSFTQELAEALSYTEHRLRVAAH